MTFVTGTTSPSLNRIRASVPLAGAGTSMATFSVSTVSTVSSNLTRSPSLLDHEMIVAFSWSISNLGMMNGTGILDRASDQCSNFLFDIGFLRYGDFFETAVVRNLEYPSHPAGAQVHQCNRRQGFQPRLQSPRLPSRQSDRPHAPPTDDLYASQIDDGACIKR